MSAFDIQSSDLSGCSVLAVDDVPINLLLVEKMLSRFNFRLRRASNGQQALEEIRRERPDLVLLDLLMPVMDGFELLRTLRSNPETADIRVVILSALNSNEDIVRGYQLGANDFITKPVVMEKLINCVATQLTLAQSER
ncbi:MAG: response regulator [Bacteroidales bacterium]|nr:response regulator [Bacteroidales bacterium]